MVLNLILFFLGDSQAKIFKTLKVAKLAIQRMHNNATQPNRGNFRKDNKFVASNIIIEELEHIVTNTFSPEDV